MLNWECGAWISMRNRTVKHIYSCASSPLKRSVRHKLSSFSRPSHKHARAYVQCVSKATRRRTKRATRGLVSQGRWTAGRKANHGAGISWNWHVNFVRVLRDACLHTSTKSWSILYFIIWKKIQVTKIFEDQDANRKFPPWAISEFV